MRLHDKTFKPLLSAEQIQDRIAALGRDIALRYAERRPLFLGVLNGSFMFAADLLKNMPIDCEISFIKLKSYEGMESTGEVRTLLGLDVELSGRDVIVVEDIIDSGETANRLMHILKGYAPASVAVCALLLKPKALRYSLPLDYVGFEIGNEFVVGYGLDYDGLGRNFDAIYRHEE